MPRMILHRDSQLNAGMPVEISCTTGAVVELEILCRPEELHLGLPWP